MIMTTIEWNGGDFEITFEVLIVSIARKMAVENLDL